MKLINRFSKPEIRAYFYYIDHKGLLYLEETEPKNFTSCIKDIRFFNFFHKNLTCNTTPYYQEYGYVSKCWGEYNFIKSQNNPIVFNDITKVDDKFMLVLYHVKKTTSNGYSEIFNPEKLFLKNGVIHHEVSLNDLQEGIFSTELSIQLADQIQDNNLIELRNQFIQISILWQDNEYKIKNVD